MDGHRQTATSMSNYTPSSRPGVRRRSVFAPLDPDGEVEVGWPHSRVPGVSRTVSQALRPVSDVLTRRGSHGRNLRPLRARRRSGGNPRLSRYTLPFDGFAEVAARIPSDHLEVRRFRAIPAELLDDCWEARRRHSPCAEVVPLDWGLDAIYFRCPEERSYADRLRNLRVRANSRVSAELLCLNRPLIPFDWGVAQTYAKADFGTFPPTGDLSDPAGGQVALDSPWAARDGSLADGAGDPGRMLLEVRKEARHVRRSREFVLYHQVEYHDQLPDAQQRLYPAIPHWWTDVFVFPNLLVPLPPVLTYRAGNFLPGAIGTESGKFFEAVLETEWTALVFARWCSDIPQRGIMWLLPPRIRQNLERIGVKVLLEGSRYPIVQVEQWIHDHDTHPWASSSQEHLVRGPDGRGAPALIEQRKQFVRVYADFRVTARPMLAMGRWSAPGVGQVAHCHADLPLPDVPGGGSGKVAEMGQVLQASNARPAEAMAHTRDDLSGVTVLPGAAEDPSGSIAVRRYGAERMQEERRAGDTRALRLPSAGPSWSTGHAPRPEEEEEILAEGRIPHRGPSFRSAPPPSMEIPTTMLWKLRAAGAFELVQYYARNDLGIEDSEETVLVREEAVVEMVRHTDELYTRTVADVAQLRDLLQETEDRLRKAEARSDLLASAYAALEANRLAGRR
jgi:hypothetical protein